MTSAGGSGRRGDDSRNRSVRGARGGALARTPAARPAGGGGDALDRARPRRWPGGPDRLLNGRGRGRAATAAGTGGRGVLAVVGDRGEPPLRDDAAAR